ncbi:dATP/dGTP pyrophosphohydrolase domain-containing protein [Ensifer sp. 22521]|uniref:dATP/dGTP pyrophosphohydrolase domain-containing protein n=1 Tax=Ensifer sp. 22521 TaxID=3453935 RepID=UPI003F87A672
METIQTYYERQIEWSRETFGPALRTKGVLDHIRKELGEIEQEPHDLSEWVDVVILAMDGFWRHGGNAADLLPALLAKQQKNMARTWPDWRSMSEDRAIEHDRSKDASPEQGAEE